MDLAAEFMEGATAEALKSVKPLDQAEKNAIALKLEEAQEAKKRVEIFNAASDSVMKRAAVSRNMAEELGKEVTRMSFLFRLEAAVDNHAARFVLKHFAKGAENLAPKEVQEKDKIKEFIDQKLVPALQLQYGERYFDAGSGRYVQNGNAQDFLKAMTDQIGEAIDEFGGGRKLYENLFTHTLPNILNRRIETSALSEGRERLHLDDVEGLKDAMNKIKRTALASTKFSGKLGRMLGQTVQGYQKLLAKQAKKATSTRTTRRTCWAISADGSRRPASAPSGGSSSGPRCRCTRTTSARTPTKA